MTSAFSASSTRIKTLAVIAPGADKQRMGYSGAANHFVTALDSIGTVPAPKRTSSMQKAVGSPDSTAARNSIRSRPTP